MNFNTNVPDAWALILRNGHTPGKRRNTRAAFLTDAIVENGQPIAYKAFIADASFNNWSVTKRLVAADMIVKRWRQKPTREIVAALKKRMLKTGVQS